MPKTITFDLVSSFQIIPIDEVDYCDSTFMAYPHTTVLLE